MWCLWYVCVGVRVVSVVCECVVWHAETPVCTFQMSTRMRALEHLNPMLSSSLIANFLLTMNGRRRVITCFRGSPKETVESYPFKVREQVENNTFPIPPIIRVT